MAGGWIAIQQEEGAGGRKLPPEERGTASSSPDLLRCSLAWRGRGSPLPAAAGDASNSPFQGAGLCPQPSMPSPAPTSPLPPSAASSGLLTSPRLDTRSRGSGTCLAAGTDPSWAPQRPQRAPAALKGDASSAEQGAGIHQEQLATVTRARGPPSQPPSLNLLWEREALSFPANQRRGPSSQVYWKAFPLSLGCRCSRKTASESSQVTQALQRMPGWRVPLGTPCPGQRHPSSTPPILGKGSEKAAQPALH